MGVYIKGMEMPGSCSHCLLRYVDHGGTSVCKAELKIILLPKDKKRPVWCPLLLIPPHGRMIDADALSQMYDPDESFGAAALEIIADTPTIIPAEEGK